MRLFSAFTSLVTLLSVVSANERMVIFNPKQNEVIHAGKNLNVQVWLPIQQGSWVARHMIFGIRQARDISPDTLGLGQEINSFAKAEIEFGNMWFIDATQPLGGFLGIGQNFTVPIPKIENISPPVKAGDTVSLVLGQLFTVGATANLWTAYAVQNYTILG
ncbi:hypothetical protein FRC08_008436 [Ceratobasidium sp. 394]|nr:hypothetical protein FRC08_008436 [Ceratobasidium sp. 394]